MGGYYQGTESTRIRLEEVHQLPPLCRVLHGLLKVGHAPGAAGQVRLERQAASGSLYNHQPNPPEQDPLKVKPEF